MQTTILFGSARRSGATRFLVDILEAELPGTVVTLSAYDIKANPCTDCRYCWHHPACAIKDSMVRVYEVLNASDCIIVASPMYFHSLPGPLKTLVDRCQVYWAERLRQDGFGQRERSGAAVFVGGAPAFERQFLGGEVVVNGLFRELHIKAVDGLRYANTDKDPVTERLNVREDVKALVQRLQGG